jgi:1,4-dihydroxy-6-naphthoate synthase
MPTIHLAHSPDADDAFMFYALAEGKIATGDRRYVHELADIETLNQRALRGELDVTAVSIHAYAHLADRYALLPHGASMGDRYGPRLVAREPTSGDARLAVRGRRIAVPGKLTTAFLTLRLYQPDFQPVMTPFDQIEDVVVAGSVDAGLLIHEGQLTYAARGLHLWADLGEWWFGETGLPLPLGGNAIRRALGPELMQAVSRDLRASIAFGLAHRDDALRYALRVARGLDRATTDAFVGMYVNQLTLDYGVRGRQAVETLLRRGAQAGFIPPASASFVEDEESPHPARC